MTFNFSSDRIHFNTGGQTINNQDLTITENGEYTAEQGYTGLGTVNVNVSGGGGSNGEYIVKVVDYDGSNIAEAHLNTDDTFELPQPPSHNGLVFQEWSTPNGIINNTVTVTDSDIVIGPVYTTSSGLSEFDFTLTQKTGLTITLNATGTKNWGDGTTDTATTHTYSQLGNYTVTFDSNFSSSTSYLFGQSQSTTVPTPHSIRLGNAVTRIPNNIFKYCYNLETVTIPNTVVSVGSDPFYESALITLIIPTLSTLSTSGSLFCAEYIIPPSNMTQLGNYQFDKCYSLKLFEIPKTVTKVFNSFENCYSLKKITIPANCNGLSSCFNNCYSLESAVIKGDYSNAQYGFSNLFNYAYSLKSVKFLGGTKIKSGTYSWFNNNSALKEIVLPEVNNIGDSCFYNGYALEKVTILGSPSSIGSNAFYGCKMLKLLDLSHCTTVPTLSSTNALSSIKAFCQIKVPSALYNDWITANNWSTYADYIIGV